MEKMTKEELKELENLKDFKVYVFEGDVYVKAEDFRKKAIECRELREELSKYKKQYQHSLGGDDELIYEEGLYD